MPSLQGRLSCLALALICVVAAGCGASFFVSSNNGRLLVLVSVDPSSADPVTFTNGQVQFTARGTFNLSPTVVNPLGNVVWTVDRPAFSGMPDLGHASISSNGVAQCAQGFMGQVTVFATAAADPSQPVSLSNQTVGTARLMCP